MIASESLIPNAVSPAASTASNHVLRERYTPPDPRLFVRNRARLAAQLKPGGIAILNAADVAPASADGTRPFIQQSDLFYLSGIDQEETILVLFPDAREVRHRELLFVRETNPQIALWEGERHTRASAAATSGIAGVYWTHNFEKIIRPLILAAKRIYLNTNEHLRADVVVESRDQRFLQWCRKAFPLHEYCRLAPLMHALRMLKTPPERELIQTACDITCDTFRHLLGFIRPGVWEFEIEAEIYHQFLRRRSRRPAFAPTLASGASACVLHYVRNNAQCQPGDMLLMDFGAEYANFNADLSRCVPVSGRFSPRQKAVYQAVLNVLQGATARLQPGALWCDYQKTVASLMEEALVGLGLLDQQALKSQNPDAPLYKKFFMHGISHHLGLDVHDYGNTHQPMAAGMLLTCEPGIYIREENLGIRLENDIWISDRGPVNLTAAAPIEIEEIEDLMGRVS